MAPWSVLALTKEQRARWAAFASDVVSVEVLAGVNVGPVFGMACQGLRLYGIVHPIRHFTGEEL